MSRSPAASISNRSAREAITLEKVNVTLEGFVRVAQPLSVPGYVRSRGSFDTSLGGIVFFVSNLCTIINLYTTLRVEF